MTRTRTRTSTAPTPARRTALDPGPGHTGTEAREAGRLPSIEEWLGEPADY
ncbi:hypothetical protein ACFCZ1_13780 [Streptomyces sp. NPDC056224]|uniref:hypothetical protein n=1 Tax=Streptomyces sp. NPDC056224 TaxID=3345750 RepID=UPI0035DCAE3E